MIPCCQTLTDQARRIGSVNTIVRQMDGTLLGHNTDYDGFAYMLRSAGAQIRGKKALILGTGGVSPTVKTVLEDLGAGEIVFISRSGPDNYENLERHAAAQVLVNATPVGMYPNTEVSPVDLGRLPNLEGVFDLIYNPARTRLLLQAEERGLCRANGLGMLVAQAKAKAETLTVTVNGAAKDVATAFDAQGNTYYRLRDLAFALKGTGAQFNVTWDGSVAVATGSAYEGEALALPGSAPTGEAVSLTLTVDGTAVSQPAVLVNGHYYLAEGFLAQLGAESALVEGVLAITAA